MPLVESGSKESVGNRVNDAEEYVPSAIETVPEGVTQAEINEANRKYWRQGEK